MTSQPVRVLAIAAGALFLTAGWVLGAELNGGTDCEREGASAEVPVIFTQGDEQITGLQFDVVYDPAQLTLGPGQPVGGDALADHVVAWEVSSPAGVLRLVVYSPTNELLSGGTLLELPFTIEPGAATPSLALWLPVHEPGLYEGPGAILANVGTVTSLPAPLPSPGTIDVVEIQDPLDQASCIGGSINFGCDAIGPGSNTYQWMKNGQPIPGAEMSDLTIGVAEPPHMGLYSCEIINVCGTFVTNSAILLVDDFPCAPTNLRVYSPGVEGRLTADWNPNPSGWVDGYRLYWGVDEGGPYTTFDDLPVVGGTTLDGLDGQTRYYFRVSASVTGYEGPFGNESDAVPAAGGLDLPQAPDYGYQTTPSGDMAHPDVVTYRFPARPGDVTVWYDAYDVDYQGEVAILVNGQQVTLPQATASSSWSGLTSVTLPDEMVKESAGHEKNVLTFDNLASPPAEETWGVRRVSIRLPAPEVSVQSWNQTVDLAIHQAYPEPTLASYDLFRDTLPDFVPSIQNRVATGFVGTIYRDDAGLANEQDYYYVARPIDTIANRGFDSDKQLATPVDWFVTPVYDLRLSKSGADDLELSWSPVVTEHGVQHYKIYEGLTPSDVTFTGETSTATSVLRPGEQSDEAAHFYLVGVVDNSGEESP